MNIYWYTGIIIITSNKFKQKVKRIKYSMPIQINQCKNKIIIKKYIMKNNTTILIKYTKNKITLIFGVGMKSFCFELDCFFVSILHFILQFNTNRKKYVYIINNP